MPRRPPAIVLIGPPAAGKSTLGELVAARLGVPFVDVDEVGDRYYAEVGWSVARLVERVGAVGRVAAEREWEPARAHAVRRVVADHPGAVVALGAGHTAFTDTEHLGTVRAALADVPHVVLVLPSVGRDAALAELRRRSLASKGTDWVRDGHDLLAGWVDDAGTRSLATSTFVTGGEPPGASAGRLAALVRGR
ncbi:shikimate kinase [Cellulosimicrobium cellulans]|uniref:shikimate kinase n=1 Tax=Cellulosimicrobium cellulans TaxID=1710 RepID=UPI001495A2CA|nr:shikimate kinase [Cellulosimicrobium cellulans]